MAENKTPDVVPFTENVVGMLNLDGTIFTVVRGGNCVGIREGSEGDYLYLSLNETAMIVTLLDVAME